MKMSMDRQMPMPGDIFRHFKGNYYQIVGMGSHSETKEELVVYQKLGSNKLCVRPADMFMSPVDKDKYPDADQLYRFEYCGPINKGE